MARDNMSYRIQIYVAVIGLIGVLGAAMIGNWDKLGQTFYSPARCAVTLVTPKDNTRFRERQLSSGKLELKLSFRWDPCPGASRYNLLVTTPDAQINLINEDTVLSPTFEYTRRDPDGIRNRTWIWKVRAFIEGRWTDWSETRGFTIAPPS